MEFDLTRFGPEVSTTVLPPFQKGAPDREFIAVLHTVSRRYVALERAIRRAIDRVAAPVCSRCDRVCCRAAYCRNTLINPWYRYLFEHFQREKAIPWERRNPPPGLGPTGCIILAGRYAYCYAYNCRVILASLEFDARGRAFQELSDLLKNIGLNFFGRRHLTDVRDWKEITLPRLERLNQKIEEGTKRFDALRSLLFMG